MMSDSYSGAVVGTSYSGSSVIACSFNGTYKTSAFYTGVIVGSSYDATVIGCQSAGTFYGEGRTLAGICGSSSKDNVISCYSTGSYSVVDDPTDDYDGYYPIGWFEETSTQALYYSYKNDSTVTFDDGSVFVDGTTVTWESAVADMNTAIKEAGYDYEYIENTDEATKDAFPYVLVEI